MSCCHPLDLLRHRTAQKARRLDDEHDDEQQEHDGVLPDGKTDGGDEDLGEPDQKAADDGARDGPDAAQDRETLQRVYERFPRLKERVGQMAGTLSGGEQQMLAMGRALMSKPDLLMLDEPSMGLAPILVQEIFDIIKELNAAGTTILLVEQNANMALSIADRAYVLEIGTIKKTGTGADLLQDDDVRKAYLGG